MEEKRVVWFFFFKQKTAYEIVSRDWSSDVCSSDLKHVEFSSGLFSLTKPHTSQLQHVFSQDISFQSNLM